MGLREEVQEARSEYSDQKIWDFIKDRDEVKEALGKYSETQVRQFLGLSSSQMAEIAGVKVPLGLTSQAGIGVPIPESRPFGETVKEITSAIGSTLKNEFLPEGMTPSEHPLTQPDSKASGRAIAGLLGILGKREFNGRDYAKEFPGSNFLGNAGASILTMATVGSLLPPTPTLVGTALKGGSLFAANAARKEYAKEMSGLLFDKEKEQSSIAPIISSGLTGVGLAPIQAMDSGVIKLIFAGGLGAASSAVEKKIKKGELSEDDTMGIVTDATIASLFQLYRNGLGEIRETAQMKAENEAIMKAHVRDYLNEQSTQGMKDTVYDVYHSTMKVPEISPEEMQKEDMLKAVLKASVGNEYFLLSTQDKVAYERMFMESFRETGDFLETGRSLQPWINSKVPESKPIGDFCRVIQRVASEPKTGRMFDSSPFMSEEDYSPYKTFFDIMKGWKEGVNKFVPEEDLPPFLQKNSQYTLPPYEVTKEIYERNPLQRELSRMGVEDLPLKSMIVELDETAQKNLETVIEKIKAPIQEDKMSIEKLPPKNQKALEEVLRLFGKQTGSDIEEVKTDNIEELMKDLDSRGIPHRITKDRISLLRLREKDLTPSQIQDMVDLAQEVRHYGLTEKQLLSFSNQSQAETWKAHLLEAIERGGQKWKPGPIGEGSGVKPSGVKKWKLKAEGFFYSGVRPWLHFGMEDKYAPFGANQDFFFQRYNDNLNSYYKTISTYLDQFAEETSKAGLDIDTYAKENVSIPGIGDLPRQQIWGVLACAADPHKMQRLLLGNYKDILLEEAQAKVQKIIDAADWRDHFLFSLERKLLEQMKPSLNDLSRDLLGHPLADNLNYTPAVSAEGEDFSSLQEMLEDLLPTHPYSTIGEPDQVGVEKGNLLERTPGARRALNLNELDNFSKYIRKMSHALAFGRDLRDWNHLIHDSEYVEAVKRNLGEVHYNETVRWVQDLDDYRTATGDMEAVGKTLSYLRSSAMVARLGLSGKAALKASTSGFYPGVLHVSSQRIWDGYREALSDWDSLKDWAESNFPQLRYRFAEYDLRNQKGLAEMSMAFYDFADRRATYGLAWGAYNDFLERHPGEEEWALKHALSIVSKTQPMTETGHAARFWKGIGKSKASQELARTVALFMQQTNQNTNNVLELIGKTKYDQLSDWELTSDLFLLSSGAILIGMISRGKVPAPMQLFGAGKKDTSSWEEHAYDITTPLLGGIPLVNLAASALAEKEPMNPIVYSPIEELYKAKTTKNPTKHILGGISSIVGIPYYSPEQTFEGMWDLLEGKTSDPRRLFYSKYQLTGKR